MDSARGDRATFFTSLSAFPMLNRSRARFTFLNHRVQSPPDATMQRFMVAGLVTVFIKENGPPIHSALTYIGEEKVFCKARAPGYSIARYPSTSHTLQPSIRRILSEKRVTTAFVKSCNRARFILGTKAWVKRIKNQQR